MTLDTVEVSIKPFDAIRIMQRHDKRNEAWSLCGVEMPEGANHRRLMLNVDGSDTCVEVTLRADGTWTASTHYVAGGED